MKKSFENPKVSPSWDKDLPSYHSHHWDSMSAFEYLYGWQGMRNDDIGSRKRSRKVVRFLRKLAKFWHRRGA